MKHVFRVLGALVRQALFLVSLVFLFDITGRTSVVLLAALIYTCRTLIVRHRMRRIPLAWGGLLAGIVALTNAPIDLDIAPAPARGVSIEENGWRRTYLATTDAETGELIRLSEDSLEWGVHGCLVEYNAAKWLIEVGLGHETDWLERARFESYMWRTFR